MSLIPVVGRKSWKARLTIAGLYLILSIGAVTMIYPFLVMLSTSIRSEVDLNDYSVVPAYLYDDSKLFAKYAEIKYASNLDQINGYYGTDFIKSEQIVPVQKTPPTVAQRKLVQDWNEFRNTLDLKYKVPTFAPPALLTSPTRLLDEYRLWLRNRFHSDIRALDKAYSEENDSFDGVIAPFQRPTNREWSPDNTPKVRDWLKFEKMLPAEGTSVVACDPLFSAYLKQDIFDSDISRLNAAYGTKHKSFNEIHLSPTMPENPAERADWENFMRTLFPFRYMELRSDVLPVYRKFLAGRYGGEISKFNHAYATSFADFDQIMLPKTLPAAGIPLVDWKDFIAKEVPIQSISAGNAENLFRAHVMGKYGNIDAVNKAYGLNVKNIVELTPPYYVADWSYVLSDKDAVRKHFITRNYVMVINYILFHGRAVFNTIVFCLAVILTHLIVNPLCAYALSRYNLRYGYKVLLFLLATMAFPAEVAMIPNFLLLKQLSMLNTYWALVLPGMASGFSIFLLKGFFDSLPKELYEAGIIDGASEPIMFWKITMPLSKPIFAVIALQSFTAAYGAFMFAFLVCQNPKMWTMMVWLYELQITAPKYITMAALTVAALPTLLIFIFCQNVIMRGIILPSYK